MGTDRINLGLHANTKLGVGLYVSKPGSNVMHPEFAVSGNLMFDSNEPLSTLHVIQSGNFKITCDRIGLSSIGKFDSDGRPQEPIWNFYHESLGYVAENSKAKLVNYLDTGMASIPIATPLLNGEIPEVALRFAVGNSSGHFHPWYANVSMDQPDSKNWDEFTYNDSSEVVHMDSPWIRMKWGGIGNEAYTGMHMTHKTEALIAEITAATAESSIARTKILESLRIDNPETITDTDIKIELKKQEDAMKMFSTGMGNMQGIVGLIHYANSTQITVNAFMTPTHSGLRDYSHNAIDDYNNWHHPITAEDYSGWEDTDGADGAFYMGRPEPRLPGMGGVPYHAQEPGRSGWIPTRKLAGTHYAAYAQNDLYGGNIYEITLEYLVQFDYLPNIDYGFGYGSRRAPQPFEAYSQVVGGELIYYTAIAPTQFNFPFHRYFQTSGPGQYEYPGVAFNHLPMVETFQSYGNAAWHWYDVLGKWNNQLFTNAEGLGHYNDKEEYWNTYPEPARGYDLLQRDHAKEDIYGWKGHPTQFFVNPFSNNMCTFSTHMAPGDTTTLAQDAAYTGSMGLGGAGSKTAMKTDDCWDTFYCSYVIYNHGEALFTYEAQAPTTVVVDVRSKYLGGDLQATGKYRQDNLQEGVDTPSDYRDNRYFNLSFPEDYVGTKGDSETDPFHEVRDYTDPQQRIYGNINIVFKIPSEHLVAEDYVNIGSDEFVRETIYIGEIAILSSYGAAAPAITFNLSDNEFIFENNKNMTLTIENSGYVLGGGGSGGRGSVMTSILASTPDQYNGGGGGAGGGSGGKEYNIPGIGAHNGVGIGGTGFGRGTLTVIVPTGTSPVVDLAAQAGASGQNLNHIDFMSKFDPHLGYEPPAPSGGSAAPSFWAVVNAMLPWVNVEPKYGGDGGDAIRIITGSVLPVVDIVNKANPGPYDAIFASGGGGGGGGVGKTATVADTIPDDGTHHQKASGVSGAAAGHHGNAQVGNPLSTFYPKENGLYVPELTQYKGGLAGYLVSDSTGGPYQGKVHIRNESTKSIYGRAPSLYEHTYPGTVDRNYNVGFSVDAGETKTHQGS